MCIPARDIEEDLGYEFVWTELTERLHDDGCRIEALHVIKVLRYDTPQGDARQKAQVLRDTHQSIETTVFHLS